MKNISTVRKLIIAFDTCILSVHQKYKQYLNPNHKPDNPNPYGLTLTVTLIPANSNGTRLEFARHAIVVTFT